MAIIDNGKWLDCPRCHSIGRVRDDSYWGPEMRRRRLATGLSLSEVARRIGVDKAHISRLERGMGHWLDETFAAYTDAIATLAAGAKGKE